MGAYLVVAAYTALLGGIVGALIGQRLERLRWRETLVDNGINPNSLAFDRKGADVSPTTVRDTQLESAVEAIALEVERISEGQRFVTKLLAEGRNTNRSPIPGSHRSPIPPPA